ncbi:MAG: lipopolysaccharide heptosyltransferase II [Rhodoferax sp.]|jgi:heptosyltransferase-2|nr:lipopolysaccharide heptosyltransferase II [Rhodoferax sp.]
MTEPLLRVLHERGERITVGALPWVAPVYRSMAAVAEVIELPFAHGGLQWSARRAMARQMRGRFQRAVVCPNSFKSALLPFWAGVPERLGYHGEARYGLLTRRLSNPDKYALPPMVDWYGALADGALPVDAQPRMQVAEQACQEAMLAQGVQAKRYFVLVPGAEYGPAKRWPAAHFAALAQQLINKHQLPVLLLGSAKDAEVCAQIASTVNAAQPGICHNLAGRTSLQDAIALVAGALAMVSNDSGLMHVAAALGVPQVAIFGSSSPLHTPPLSPLAQVIWLKQDAHYQPPLDCAPCFARQCPLGHTRCLGDVTVAMVVARLDA